MFREDGTFEATGVSFDLISDVDTSKGFTARGTWRLVDEGAEVKFSFLEAWRGDFPVQPTSYSKPFTSGTLHFFDPEETMGIEFRLE